MSKVKTYAVNCNDAWLNTEGDDISGSYVKYADYMTLATKLDLAERACAAMAAESAALKDINAWCKTDAFSNMYREFKTAEAVGCCNADCMHDAMMVAIMHAPEVPVTETFLVEIERKAIRKFINSIEHILRDKLSPYDTEEMLEAMRIFLEEQSGEQK